MSTAARDGRSSVGASGVGGVGDGGADGIGSACGAGGVCGGGSAGCFTRGVCGGVTGGPSRSSSTISAMVIEFEPDVELTTAPFWIRVRQTPSPAACLALAAVVYRSLWPSATSRRSLEARFSCSLVIFDGLRPASAQAASAAFDDGGACVGGIGSACGAGGVCDCGSGGAGCFTRGVYGGVAGGPSPPSLPIARW